MAWKKKAGNKKANKMVGRKAPAGVVYAPRKAPKAIGRINVKSLANAVAKINCEKKEWSGYVPGLTVGQIYVPAAGSAPNSGHYLTNFITPLPNNGNSDTTRVGDEIKITGIHNVFQFSHQANTSQSMKVKMMFIAPRFGISGASLTMDKLLNPNPIIYNANGAVFPIVYDTMCARNMDYIRDFRVLRTKTFTMPGDTASLSQKIVKTVDFSLKFKKPWNIRFDTAGNLAFGQIYLLVLCESGNTTTNTPTSYSGVPVIDTYSGLNLSYYTKSYFIDP